MIITATELRKRLSYYLEVSKHEDIYVTKNNKIFTILTQPRRKALNDFLSLSGVISDDKLKNKSYRNIVAEELAAKHFRS